MIFLSSIMFAIIIPIVLLTLVVMVGKESDGSRNKIQPFECGFENFSSSRISFSLKYYMIVIIFLVFDVEIVLILPIPLAKSMVTVSSWLISSYILMFILLLGLGLEWAQGVFEWTD